MKIKRFSNLIARLMFSWELSYLNISTKHWSCSITNHLSEAISQTPVTTSGSSHCRWSWPVVSRNACTVLTPAWTVWKMVVDAWYLDCPCIGSWILAVHSRWGLVVHYYTKTHCLSCLKWCFAVVYIHHFLFHLRHLHLWVRGCDRVASLWCDLIHTIAPYPWYLQSL